MRLVLIATSANQSYIFASNRLREAVGASELVRLSTTEWVRKAAGTMGARIVQESSGSAILLVEGPDEARRVINGITRQVLRDAPGMDIAGASVPINGPVPAPDDIEAVFQAHTLILARRASTLGRFQRLPAAAACASTGRPAAAWHSDAARAPEGGAKPNEEPRPLSAEVITKRLMRPAADGRMRDQAGVPLVNIDTFFDRVERVAVVHADGNGLGAVFRNAAQCLGGAEQVKELSEQVQRAADQALRHAASQLLSRAREAAPRDLKRACPLVPLIVGGDDLTALVDGRFALAFVRDYLQRFGELTRTHVIQTASGRECLTASAGIAIVTPHFPFSTAYHIAEQLCASAKAPTRDNPMIHSVDLHVQLDSLASDLETVRARYRNNDTVLHERPFLLPADGHTLSEHEEHRSLDQLTHRVRMVQALARGREDGRVVTRTQLHALREELRTDPGRAQRRFADLWRRAQPCPADREALTALAGAPGDPPELLRPGANSMSLLDALEIDAITPEGGL